MMLPLLFKKLKIQIAVLKVIKFFSGYVQNDICIKNGAFYNFKVMNSIV